MTCHECGQSANSLWRSEDPTTGEISMLCMECIEADTEIFVRGVN